MMPFLCPDCAEGSLDIVAALELPPDSRSDEISLQVVRCMACGFSGLAVYEESRRGAIDSEAHHHTGYHAGPDLVAAIEWQIGECPAPHNPRCDCPIHQELSAHEEAGRWSLPQDINEIGGFALVAAPESQWPKCEPLADRDTEEPVVPPNQAGWDRKKE